jgi:hypothetical protein
MNLLSGEEGPYIAKRASRGAAAPGPKSRNRIPISSSVESELALHGALSLEVQIDPKR